MKPQRPLVWINLSCFAALIIAVRLFTPVKVSEGIHLDTVGQPTIGAKNCTVHVVAFEEPKCTSCKEYSLTIFPKLKKEYIDTGKVRYTLIPVSFLPGSMPAATSLLCAYNMNPKHPNPDLLFSYLDTLYRNQPSDESIDWATKPHLMELAGQTSDQINQQRLGTCIDIGAYRVQIEKNTLYGGKVMGSLSTPTLYVNGMEVKTLTYDELSRMINDILEK